MDQASSSGIRQQVFLILAIILICFNLRPAMTAPDPLLGELRHDLGLSMDDSGTFALLPVFVLGIAAALAPRVARLLLPWKIILIFPLVAVAGILWRSYGGMIGLYGGMIVMGLGLGIAGAAIPGFIKHTMPDKAPFMMGIYSALVGLGTSVAAATAYPIAANLGGWKEGLAFWAAPILLACAIWGCYFKIYPSHARQQPLETNISRLLTHPRAWQITLFYMSRVAAAYFLFTWFPILLKGRGMNGDDAGYVLSLITLSQIPATLVAHWGEEKLGGHGRLITLALASSVISCWAIMYGPLEWVIPFSIICGLGTGAVFSRGMSLMVERADNETTALELSGMSQGFGFTFGALMALGGSFVLQHGSSILPFCLIYTAFCIMGIVTGRLSARPGYV
jgi:CP family cyanate transporter-like MFS transporter